MGVRTRHNDPGVRTLCSVKFLGALPRLWQHGCIAFPEAQCSMCLAFLGAGARGTHPSFLLKLAQHMLSHLPHQPKGGSRLS